MNRERRAQIHNLTKELALITVRVESQNNKPTLELIEAIINKLHLIEDEEVNAIANTPESFINSQRYLESEGSLEDISTAISLLYNILNDIKPLTDKLNSCISLLADI